MILEEMNRANGASVFGDLFQLLDRKNDGASEYYVKVNELNHKQLVYHFIFGNKVKANYIYNSLIIPTEKTIIHQFM